MGLSIGRAGADFASTHTPLSGGSPHINSPYASNSNTVLINGLSAIAIGDATLCGDIAITGSGTVFINGRAAHRNGDLLDNHVSTFTPSVCVGSGAVYAG
jgi:uncharacterized Zn-binding protein involved in type VI secretion